MTKKETKDIEAQTRISLSIVPDMGECLVITLDQPVPAGEDIVLPAADIRKLLKAEPRVESPFGKNA